MVDNSDSNKVEVVIYSSALNQSKNLAQPLAQPN